MTARLRAGSHGMDRPRLQRTDIATPDQFQLPMTATSLQWR